MTKKLKNILAELRCELEKLYGERLAGVVLFGSQARGDAAPDSDIDVLVVLRGDVRDGEEISRTSKITADLSLANDVVISCVFVSDKQFAIENSPLLLNIRKEGVAL
jgi:predicted nucleotidyltransferase